ncbi:hypothetical protein CES85_1667 [Ochrobactrum quorumnocens]|uniref:Uncharacterized protein n=1 Tax=Ochrobactrum quorumnocens TaxID=271865 RepID=A0A248UFE4_9HYPH|nr:hypothetical protein [[Ochrobactrum] quorumnocens]ASV85131.1 hypothetical protein CES85_1667 [[Ochrobactrum] quorumnocens]
MTDTMLPILRAMHDEGTDAGRAAILLTCPISIMLKYRQVLEGSCERHGFAAGSEYLTCFYAAMHQTRYRGNVRGAALKHAEGQLLLLCDAVSS